MKLYLHIGTEKTGSSFLQSLIYFNKEFLQRNHHIFIPKDLIQDKKMSKGLISGGNGVKLYELLKSNNNNKISDYLKEIKNQALESQCESILISNENLFQVLGQNFKTFFLICDGLKINVQMCLFLREPLSHIISMYKHRNKNGKYPNFEFWIKNYTTIFDLEVFSNGITQNSKLDNLKAYMYEKETPVEKFFFQDFLGINLNDLSIKHKNVNTSLTFSEIAVLQIIHKRNMVSAENISSYFRNIATSKKAKDSEGLVFYHENIALDYVINNFNNINKSYNFFGKKIPSKNEFIEMKYFLEKKAKKINDTCCTLSINQIETIIYCQKNDNNLVYFFIKLIRNLFKYLVPTFIIKYFKYHRI
jgi:hypothetical protein